MRPLIVFLLFLLCFRATGTTIGWEEDMSELSVREHMEFVVADPTDGIEQILLRKNWIKLSPEAFKTGEFDKSYWVQFSLTNRSSDELFLMMSVPAFARLDFYEVNTLPDGEEIVRHRMAFFQKEFRSPATIYSLGKERQSPGRFYLRVNQLQYVSSPMTLLTGEKLLSDRKSSEQAFGFFSGLFFFVFVFSLIFYLFYRDGALLYYSFCIFLIYLFFLFSSIGYPDFISSFNPLVEDLKLYVVITAIGPAWLLFFNRFFKAWEYNKPLSRMLIAFSCSYTLIPFLYFGGSQGTAFASMHVLNLVAVGLSLYTGFDAITRGAPRAKSFVIAWSVFLAGFVMFGLQNLQVMPYNVVAERTMQFGAVFGVVAYGSLVGSRFRKNLFLRVAPDNPETLLQWDIADILRENMELRFWGLANRFDPHMIYNVLNNAYMRLREGDLQGSAELIHDVALTARKGLNLSERKVISLFEELEYLQLMIRAENRRSECPYELSVKIQGDINVYEPCFPALLTQVFVENSLKYMRKYGCDSPIIRMDIRLSRQDEFEITIDDCGPGFVDEKLGEGPDGKSMGMDIAKSRVDLLRAMGYHAQIEILNKIECEQFGGRRGVWVKIMVPKIYKDKLI